MGISIIIPTINEAEFLPQTLSEIRANAKEPEKLEIIISDGGSTDDTLKVARNLDVTVVNSDQKGRGAQMNCGAKAAKHSILYFLHADSFPPKSFDQLIYKAINSGKRVGCFQLEFQPSTKFLRFFEHFVKYNVRFTRGGDQSLFIQKKLFRKINGFSEFKILEDIDMYSRIVQIVPFHILRQKVITSSRKYKKIGQMKLQFVFLIIHVLYAIGCHPDNIYTYFKGIFQNE